MKFEPSLKNIREGKPFYVVAVCFAVDVEKGKALLLKRAKTQMVHGGLWAPLGGKLEWNDLTETGPSRKNGAVEDWEHIMEHLLKREALEEANIQIDHFKYLDSVAYIRPDGMPSICLKFAGQYLGGEVRYPSDFKDYHWFGAGGVHQEEAILGVPEELDRAISLFK